MTDTRITKNKKPLFGHNFGVVYRFEVVRTIKKKSFWLSILAFPLMFAVIFAIAYFAGRSTEGMADKLADQSFKIAITDESQLINPDLTKSMNVTTVDNKQAGIEQVKAGKTDAYFYYPADLTKNKLEIYAQDVGLFESGKYDTVAKQLLANSVQANVTANEIAVLSSNISTNATYYKDGEIYNQIGDMIMPAVFLVLFYLIICIFGSQMLAATVEEKENRITEMILTTIKSRTLIIGKIFAFMTLILIQAMVIIALVTIGYLIAKQYINLPNFDLSIITFNPVRITIGAVLFIVSTLLFSGLLVAIGAAAPTAKEANQFVSIPILLLFMPLYVTGIVISTPEAPIVTALIMFPFTAPVLLMLMNALGTLVISTAIISIVIMSATTVAVFIIASRIFQTGAISYGKMVKLPSLRKLRG